MDQGAQQRFVAHDLDVVLDAGPVRHPVEQSGNVSRAANGFQLAIAGELFGQGDQVNRVRRLGKVNHPRVNSTVRVEQKIFGLEMLGCLVIGEVVGQDRA